MAFMSLLVFTIFLLFFVLSIHSAVLKSDDNDVKAEGLYSMSDHVTILNHKNFDQMLYRKNHGWFIQFYNSQCGHCRHFRPTFTLFAESVWNWKKAVKVGVIDCMTPGNVGVCRQMNIDIYPCLLYFHPDFKKGFHNKGANLSDSAYRPYLASVLAQKLRNEQQEGRLPNAPSLAYEYVTDLGNAVNSHYNVFVFESQNSTLGIQMVLEFMNYDILTVKSAAENSPVTRQIGVTHFPSLVITGNSLDKPVVLYPNPETKESYENSIKDFLRSQNVEILTTEAMPTTQEIFVSTRVPMDIADDVIYQTDLEAALKQSLEVEITAAQVIEGEKYHALLNYLKVLRDYFPFKANGKEYIVDFIQTLSSHDKWTGGDVSSVVQSLITKHAPVYSTNGEYKGCKGSEPQYRGYTCGVWQMFHSLTVNADQQNGNASLVLRAMHGYIKHFFACTHCSQHFQAMAENLRLFQITSNDKAVMWLWIAHNEVNLRLSGDETEDPMHKKIQYPSLTNCDSCRDFRGTWTLKNVYKYLQNVYARDKIKGPVSQRAPYNPLSNVDIGLLSLMYLLCFIIIVIAVKLYVSRNFRRKKGYKFSYKDNV